MLQQCCNNAAMLDNRSRISFDFNVPILAIKYANSAFTFGIRMCKLGSVLFIIQSKAPSAVAVLSYPNLRHNGLTMAQ